MEPLDFAKQRMEDVKRLAGQFGNKKVNLVYADGGSEGIWCVPLTADDDRKMSDDHSRGEKVRVYLVNQPLGWGGRTWGAEVIATTRGDQRPDTCPDDQIELDSDTWKLNQGLRNYSISL